MPFTRRYPGKGPFEEVWFCEVLLGPDRGLWLRYTVCDSDDPAAPHRSCAVWAMPFWGRDRAAAYRDTFPLSHLERRGPFHVGHNVLTELGAEGSAGPVRWSLAFHDRGLVHRHIPRLLGALPIPRRSYAPAILDLRVTGEVWMDGEAIDVVDGPGVLGHIWGASNATRSWAWSHCNTFEQDPDAVFEGIGALLDRPLLRRRPLTSLVVHVRGQTYRFSTTRALLANDSEWGSRRWSFGARRGGFELSGEATLPDRGSVRVPYTKPDGSRIDCENARFSSLTLRVRGPGVNEELTSTSAAFELGSRERLEGLHLPA